MGRIRSRVINAFPQKAPRLSYGDGLARGLALAYPTNESGGGRLHDAVNAANRLTITNAPTWGPGLQSTPALALSGGTLQYASSTTMVGLPIGANQPFTVAQWLYPITGLAGLAGFWQLASSGGGAVRALINYGSGIYFWGNSNDKDSGTNWTFDAWQLVTLSYDGTNLTFYKNRNQLGSPQALTLGSAPNSYFFIGKSDFNVATSAKIGPTYVWRRGLKSSDVAMLYAQKGKPFYFSRIVRPVSAAAVMTRRPLIQLI